MTGNPEDLLVQDAHADAEATRKTNAAAIDASQLPAKPGERATP